MSPEDLVGIAEIATMLGVSGRTAHNYSLRLGFPEPYGRTAGGRVWLRTDVETWAREALPLRVGRPRKESRGGKGERPGNHDTA